jgi:SprT protein
MMVTDIFLDTVKRVNELIDYYNKYKNTTIPNPRVEFTLRGKVAGCVSFNGDDAHINFNKVLLQENFDDFIEQTIPHEVSHYIVFKLYGHQYNKTRTRRVVHGPDWKYTMRFFGCDPKLYHSYSTKNSTVRKLKTFTYRCSCSEVELTSIRHNRVQKGTAKYRCSKCKTRLEYVG